MYMLWLTLIVLFVFSEGIFTGYLVTPLHYFLYTSVQVSIHLCLLYLFSLMRDFFEHLNSCDIKILYFNIFPMKEISENYVSVSQNVQYLNFNKVQLYPSHSVYNLQYIVEIQ